MTEILHLSSCVDQSLIRTATRLDASKTWSRAFGNNTPPPLVGAVTKIEGRNLFVPIRKIGGLEAGQR